MAAERLSMRKIKEVLRLTAAGLSGRAVAVSLAIAHSTVREYRRRAETAGVSWAVSQTLTEREIESLLFPAAPRPSNEPRPLPDWRVIHDELKRKRKTGVTLQLLWHEYKEANPGGLQYSQFCERYRDWRSRLDLVLRQEHKAGDKVFVDFAGQTVSIVDRQTGEIREAQIFVGVLGASNYTYAEACASQELPEWIGAHVRMFEFFGGTPALIVPDNLRSGVRHACYYEPDLNPTYHEMAVHYGTAVLPARKRKPRDKAKVEAGVLLVERWILARLRHRTFFSLAELNAEIRQLLEHLNTRLFQKLEGSRCTLFESLDRPALNPLPPTRYEFAQWKRAKVNIDYHVEVLGHYYSVPYQLERARVDVRVTRSAVEILHEGRRVAAHVRSFRKGQHTTDPAHRPKSHQKHVEWTPSRILRWAEQTGPNTAALADQIMKARPHPEQGYRSCLGLLRLGERYGKQRLEAACERALRVKATSYRSVQSILQRGLDQLPAEEQALLALPQNHDNIRGAHYYAAATGEL